MYNHIIKLWYTILCKSKSEPTPHSFMFARKMRNTVGAAITETCPSINGNAAYKAKTELYNCEGLERLYSVTQSELS